MSVYVTKLVEEIKLLKGSRAREETMRAKATCVGGAREKVARAKKEVEQEEAHVYETLVSSRLAEVQEEN